MRFKCCINFVSEMEKMLIRSDRMMSLTRLSDPEGRNLYLLKNFNT